MRKSLFIGLVAILGLIGCSRNQEIDVPDANLSLFARTESPADTKTVVESGVHVYWEPGDEIAVFMGEKSAKFTTDITAASGTATFKGTFGDTSWPEELDLWAVYPFSEDATFDGETITTTLPSEQVARPGSFGKDMNLAIAHSNSSTLQFYNVGGGIRFSVTEEGIKKVMFEGLSGEIISGKVKIGMDENGKPVVKEVTGGSQFITLLPPTGQETFEPGAWYYIVAIPGSLEGGYKLRFYKDSDYARKVSEKAVEIKRSIFGSLEKADSGIEYEATTTHFPETEEEWNMSNNLSLDISKQVGLIMDELKSSSHDNLINANELASKLLNIDGIIDSYPVGDDIGVVFIQNNGVHINIELREPDMVEELEANNSPAPVQSMRTSASEKVSPNPYRRKALLFAPFQSTGNSIPINIVQMENDLNGADFHFKYFIDWNATLDVFSPEILSQYDLIIVQDHGGYHDIFTDTKGNPFRSTYFKTGSTVGSSSMNSTLWKNVGAFLSHDEKGTVLRYATSAPLLEAIESYSGEEASFDRSIVIAMACNSLKYNDFADYFTRRGAAVYYGNKDFVHSDDARPGVVGMVKYLCMGMSVRNAMEMMKKKDFTILGQLTFPGDISDEPFGTARLINPIPTDLHNSEIRDAKTTLIWDQAKTIGDYRFKVYLKWPNSDSYSAYNSTTSKAFTTDALQPGDYSWYVEANLYYDGKVVETFLSDTKSFTVKEKIHYETPEAIDLGLSVKWASFNLGATKKEDYGYYYAWGETEPKDYYYWSYYKWGKAANELTKYTALYDTDNSYHDCKYVLELDDDAAYVNLGKEWRIPSREEWNELKDNCTWTWTTEYGEGGYKIKSKNGNYIFLPVTGYAYLERFIDKGTRGYYWCSSFNHTSSSSSHVPDVDFGENQITWNSSNSRCYGEAIRPVHPTPVTHISLDNTLINLYVDFNEVVSAIASPQNASHNYVWSVDDNSVLFFLPLTNDNTSCLIKGLSPGTATITVTALDGGVSASCRVTVEELPPVTESIISASPTSINYGDVKVGEWLGNETGRVTFTNTGNDDLSIDRIDCPEGFSHSSAYTFPIVISPGNDKTIVFAFKPTEAKTYSGYVQVYSNASNGLCEVRVTGKGIE